MHGQKRSALIVLGVALWLSDMRAQSPGFTIKSIAPNVWAAIADPAGGAGGNAGIVAGDNGVLVVDTFVSIETGQQLLAGIRKLTTLPITYVVNTHYHFDHVGGNRVFSDAGAVLFSHHNLRRWIVSENLLKLGPTPRPELKSAVEAVVVPAVVFEQGVDLYLGARTIEVRSFPGHTGGDAVVFVPDAKVAFAGDLLWRDVVPNLVDATTSLWIETLNDLRTPREDWTFVPGHGDIASAHDVMAFGEYLSTLRALVSHAQRQGKSGDAVVDAVIPTLKDKYARQAFFDYLAKPNIVDTDAELKGSKRVPK